MKTGLQSFLTSYLIGCKNQRILANSLTFSSAPYMLVLHDIFYIPVLAKSLTGFHTFGESIFKRTANFNELSFQEFIEEICICEDANQEDSKIFLQRVLAGQKVMIDLAKTKKDLLENIITLKDLSFKTTEQALIHGHFAHPYPKLQEHESSESHLENELNLKWHLAHKSILHIESSKHFSIESIRSHLKKIYKCEIDSNEAHADDYFPFPIHPLQYETLMSDACVKSYFEQGLIKPLASKSSLSSWIPTTSLRTIYNENAEWMLKFSLGVRLTNSIRTLQENEVKRGMQMHEVLAAAKTQGLLNEEDLRSLQIIHEPIFLALKDATGSILKSTIVVLRENVFYKNSERTICLATLNQNSLLVKILESISLDSDLAHVSLKWFDAFMDKIICPFIILQARHGIYLGAHQQNLIIALDENYFPSKVYYRDCQGTGYSEYGYEKFKAEALSLQTPNGNVLPVDFANSLMGYYLFINSTLFTIKTIANGNLILERSLIKAFVIKIKSLKGLHDDSFIKYVLESESFLIKDNFECCLKNINENTMSNPLDIYKVFNNPFLQENL